MSIALHSARRAARLYLKGESPDIYQKSLARQLSAQLHRATIISRMLVSETGQALAMTGAGIFPFVLPVSAGLTRIPSRALGERS
jgi:hypothetical protein